MRLSLLKISDKVRHWLMDHNGGALRTEFFSNEKIEHLARVADDDDEVLSALAMIKVINTLRDNSAIDASVSGRPEVRLIARNRIGRYRTQ